MQDRILDRMKARSRDRGSQVNRVNQVVSNRAVGNRDNNKVVNSRDSNRVLSKADSKVGARKMVDNHLALVNAVNA
jgi:hypothetical protein